MIPQLVFTVAEYDPFHRGHQHHLDQLKERAPHLVRAVILGGVFTQRGEPALFSPWARAEMALKAGANLVFALPHPFCCANAGLFALGAVKLAQATGLAAALSFGCEEQDALRLKRAALILGQEGPTFKEALQDGLKKGLGYATAQAQALETLSPGDGDLLRQPNAALALAYLKNAARANWDPELYVVKREKNDGHHGELSATQARILLRKGEPCPFLPEESEKIAARELQAGRFTPTASGYWPALLAQLNSMERHELEKKDPFGEGLAPKALELARKLTPSAEDWAELIEALAGKRHPRSRIRRGLIHAYLGLSIADVLEFQKQGPQWLQLLGADERGRNALAVIKKQAALPLISRPAELYRLNNAQKAVELETRALRLWNLLLKKPDAAWWKAAHPIIH